MVEQKTSSGNSNLIAAVGYLIPIIPLLFLLAKKDDKFLKFHAIQAVVFAIVIFAIYAVLGPAIKKSAIVGSIFYFLFFVILLVLIFLMYKAAKGEVYKLPIIGKLCEKNV